MHTEWDGQVGILSPTRPLPHGNSAPRVCSAWQRRTGDAGWAGQLAEWLQNNPTHHVYLVFDRDNDSDLLPLIDETLSLLSPQLRWGITFSTYYIGTQSATCALRGLANSSDEAQRAESAPQAKVLNLVTAPSRHPAAGPFAEAARTGTSPSQSPKLTDTEWPTEWELEAAPAVIGSFPSPGSDRNEVTKGGVLSPTREFDFADTRPANDLRSQFPPAIPQRTRFSGSAWVLAVTALGLVLLSSLGTAAFYMLSSPSVQHGKEAGLLDPDPTGNGKQALLEMLESSDQALQDVYHDRNAIKQKLALKDQALVEAERKLQAPNAKPKEPFRGIVTPNERKHIGNTNPETKPSTLTKNNLDHRIDAAQAKNDGNSSRANTSAPPGTNTRVETEQLTRVAYYCALPADSQQEKKPLEIRDLSDHNPDMPRLDRHYDFKLHAPPKDASTGWKLTFQAGEPDKMSVMLDRPKEADVAIASFEKREKVIKFAWKAQPFEDNRQWMIVRRMLKNSVIELEERTNGTSTKTQHWFFGLKRTRQVGKDGVFYPADKPHHIPLNWPEDEKPISNTELVVAFIKCDFNPRPLVQQPTRWEPAPLIINLQPSVQKTANDEYSLSIQSPPLDLTKVSTPAVAIRSFDICSKLDSLAVVQFHYGQ
jgi:hypothetical protein